MASRDKVADAEECKAKGNACLQAKDFDKAIEWYNQALSLHKSHVYYSNRSAAYLSKNFGDSALKDANECIKLKPDWAKGFSRKGAALHKLGKLDEAISAFQEGLALDPANAGLKSGLEAVEAQKNAPPGGMGGMGGMPGGPDAGIGQMFAGLMDKVKAHPKLSQYLSDPSYVAMLNMLQTNPQNLQMFMQDPRMMETLSAVLGVQFEAPPGGAGGASQAKESSEDRKKREAEEKKKKEEEEKRKKQEEYDALSPEEKEKLELKEKAKEFKQAGNELYKKKQFEQALEQYDKAIECDPTDMTFITNRAAVILEQGNLQGCLDECKKAIETGRKNYADYPLIAKAYARMGNACYKHKNYKDAITYYNQAQLEHKTVKVDDMLRKVQKKEKEESAKAYIDPPKGLEAKERGNEKFKSGDFPGAIKEYDEATKRDPTNAVYYNNRAAAYMKVADFGRAMDDCKKSIELDPANAKAWARKGNIEFFLKEYHKALDSYKKGLELDPENKTCAEGLTKTSYAVQTNAGTQDAQRSQRAMEDPEIRNIMSDPVMKQVLQDMGANPASAAKHMQNPEVAAKIEKLIAAGIIQTR